MGFRRGFKTEANSLAADLRGELRLRPLDALDPFRLAQHLDIPVLPMSTFLAEAPAIVHLRDVEPEAFSAGTVFAGTKRAIVYNDSHCLARQNSDVAHECGHALLQHPPRPALDHRGCRDWDQDIEDEAAWLGGVLLVPEDAAIEIARQRQWPTIEAAAIHFGVSVEMINYRVNVTGARTRVDRMRRRWRG